MTNTLPRFASDNAPALTLSELLAELVARGIPGTDSDQECPQREREPIYQGPAPSWHLDRWCQPKETLFETEGHFDDVLAAGDVLVVIPSQHYYFSVYFSEEERLIGTNIFHSVLRYNLAVSGWHGWSETHRLISIAEQLHSSFEARIEQAAPETYRRPVLPSLPLTRDPLEPTGT